MAAIDVIRRRLKEERVPDIPDDIGEKKKRPREVAFMDVNLCFAPSVTFRFLQWTSERFWGERCWDRCPQRRSLLFSV